MSFHTKKRQQRPEPIIDIAILPFLTQLDSMGKSSSSASINPSSSKHSHITPLLPIRALRIELHFDPSKSGFVNGDHKPRRNVGRQPCSPFCVPRGWITHPGLLRAPDVSYVRAWGAWGGCVTRFLGSIGGGGMSGCVWRVTSDDGREQVWCLQDIFPLSFFFFFCFTFLLHLHYDPLGTDHLSQSTVLHSVSLSQELE